MTDRKNIVTLGIGTGPGKLLWLITSGLESPVVLDTSVTIELFLPPDDLSLTIPEDNFDLFLPLDDLSLTVPEEQTEYTDWYGQENLVDEDGNQLVDEDGNLLIAQTESIENVYVLHIPPDDLSINVPEET